QWRHTFDHLRLTFLRLRWIQQDRRVDQRRPISTLTDFASPPPGCVSLSYDFRVRHRADRSPNLDLLVPLDRGFPRAASRFAPNDLHVRTDLNVGINDAERQHRAFVVAIAAEH